MKLGKVILVGVLGVIGAFFAWKLLLGVLGAALSLIVPAGIVLAIGFVIFRIIGGDKALPGSGRSLQ